jgi:hypothetical protein
VVVLDAPVRRRAPPDLLVERGEDRSPVEGHDIAVAVT